MLDRHRFTLQWLGTLFELKPIGSGFNFCLLIECGEKKIVVESGAFGES